MKGRGQLGAQPPFPALSCLLHITPGSYHVTASQNPPSNIPSERPGCPDSCLMSSIIVIKGHGQKQQGEGKAYFSLQYIPHGGKSRQ